MSDQDSRTSSNYEYGEIGRGEKKAAKSDESKLLYSEYQVLAAGFGGTFPAGMVLMYLNQRELWGTSLGDTFRVFVFLLLTVGASTFLINLVLGETLALLLGSAIGVFIIFRREQRAAVEGHLSRGARTRPWWHVVGIIIFATVLWLISFLMG